MVESCAENALWLGLMLKIARVIFCCLEDGPRVCLVSSVVFDSLKLNLNPELEGGRRPFPNDAAAVQQYRKVRLRCRVEDR